jgi:multiple sugar transport system substrate-binding protein
MTIDGKKWGVPYTYYQWGIYFNKDAYKAAGVDVPGPEGVDWATFISNCEKFAAAGIDCLTTGTKALWPGAGIFDYMSLRTNGYEWHMDLTAGKVAWTDDSVRAVFTELGKLQPYVTANHAAIDWQDAAAILVQGKAANYVMGNFAVATFKQGGMTNDNLGFMAFPEITPGIPRSEDAPTDTIHITAGAKNVDDAKLFLAFVASADAQTKLNAAIGQLPTNKNSTVPQDDPFLVSGFQMLSTAHALSQFFDRDAPAEMAKAGMEGIQQFLIQPDQLDAILERLEQVRGQVYK